MYNVFLNLFSVLLLYVTKKQVEYIYWDIIVNATVYVQTTWYN